MNYTMTVSIITGITCLFAVALTEGGPIGRQAAQSEKTVPIGGNVTLLCPFFPDDIWKWVYWKKNNHTIYALEVKSNTTTTNDPRYEGSNHATRLTIKDLKKTDSGIYHCEVVIIATTDYVEEGGRVLLSVTDQEVGPPTTSPGVPFRAFTTIPPQPAENDENIVFLIIISILSIIFVIISVITACHWFKYRKRIKNLQAELASALRRLAPRRTSIPLGPDSSHHEIRDKSVTSTSLLSSDTHDRDDVDVDDRPEGSSNASQALNICKTDDGTIQQLSKLTLSLPI